MVSLVCKVVGIAFALGVWAALTVAGVVTSVAIGHRACGGGPVRQVLISLGNAGVLVATLLLFAVLWAQAFA